MAKVMISSQTVVVSLSLTEKFGGLHGDVTVPRSAVRSSRVAPHGMDELHGVRAPGTALPGMLMVGTWRNASGAIFAACHGRRPALVLELVDQPYDRLVITVDDPEAVVADLRHYSPS